VHGAVVDARAVGCGGVGLEKGRQHHRKVAAHGGVLHRVRRLVQAARRAVMIVVVDHGHTPARGGGGTGLVQMLPAQQLR
jgi:hypothetical protein